MITALNPYLWFNGNAEKAIAFYEQALGAQKLEVLRYGEMPPDAGPACKPEDKDRVMHSRLRIGQAELMVSDTHPSQPVGPDGNIGVVLHFDDVAELTRRFDALARDGQVTLPLHDAFFGGAKFGMVRDAFGVRCGRAPEATRTARLHGHLSEGLR